jgi:hypothetical protein
MKSIPTKVNSQTARLAARQLDMKALPLSNRRPSLTNNWVIIADVF